jgi:uncharacterized damage-inducible protein DinB
MATREHFETLAQYNRWMNERLYAVCRELSDADRKQDRGAFFRSIHGTLNHGLLGDRLWLARFRHEGFTTTGLDEELYADFETLSRERGRTDDAIDAFVAGLEDQALAAPFRFRAVVVDREFTFELRFLVTHFFNHQTHHRGQLTTLLSQAGVEPGVTDLLWLPGAELTPAGCP